MHFKKKILFLITVIVVAVINITGSAVPIITINKDSVTNVHNISNRVLIYYIYVLDPLSQITIKSPQQTYLSRMYR